MIIFSKIKEILHWHELIFSLALRDLKAKYREATGGFGWMFIAPLVQMGIFTFIFLFLFKIKIKQYPLFLLSGLLPWSFLRSSLDSAANSILNNINLVKKTFFPKEILPISSVIGNLITFIFSLLIVFILSFYYKVSLLPAILWLPIIILLQFILLVGFCLIAAGLNTIYRETQFIMDIVLLIWFYMTPVVYNLEMAKNTLKPALFDIYAFNPMLGIISGYQQIFVYGQGPDLTFLLNAALVSFLVFILGVLGFSRLENILVDLI